MPAHGHTVRQRQRCSQTAFGASASASVTRMLQKTKICLELVKGQPPCTAANIVTRRSHAAAGRRSRHTGSTGTARNLRDRQSGVSPAHTTTPRGEKHGDCWRDAQKHTPQPAVQHEPQKWLLHWAGIFACGARGDAGGTSRGHEDRVAVGNWTLERSTTTADIHPPDIPARGLFMFCMYGEDPKRQA
jgi:hypothetical protein